MSEKFKNCFTSKLPQYQYDITIDGETFAKAHLLSAGDRAYIEAKSMTKTFAEGTQKIDINSQDLITANIVKALSSWVLDAPIAWDTVSDLIPSIRTQLFEAITAHETEADQTAEDTEKN